MHIVPINNTNFKGQFKNNPALKRLLAVSDKETLGRFNDVLERAARVDDKYLYKISCIRTRSVISPTEFLNFVLYREDTLQKFTSSERMVERYVNFYDTPQKKLEKCSGVLKQFLPFLEKEYPKTNYESSSQELLEQINKKLV